MSDDEPSDSKKQKIVEFVWWLRAMFPELPHNAEPKEYMAKMTGVQKKQVLKRLAELHVMD